MTEHLLGDNVEFRENSNGEPVLEHTPSGATLVYDSSAGAWTVGDFAATSVNTDEGTVAGNDAVGIPATSDDLGLSTPSGGNDTGYQTVSSDRPAIVEFELSAFTDGTTRGFLRLDIDETGNSYSDYRFVDIADAGLGSGVRSLTHPTILLPSGGQYKIFNIDDPTGNNRFEAREFVL